MMMMYLTGSLVCMFMFFYLNNPLTLGLILILQTITLALFLGNLIKSFWFLYLLILIFIGGMLVLFIYVTSIFPNEKFDINNNNTLNMIGIMIFLLLSITIYINFFNLSPPIESLEYLMLDNKFLIPSVKMFSFYTSLLFIFMVNYLFYCMIVVIKIVNFFKGPLRKMN
uniref:NADH-ubiquinone oxidoreductase chain 6 n=1 Tax=Malostenopsocus yunnanicus TaxID=3074937 RepID=A0AAU7VBE5_9NEOP